MSDKHTKRIGQPEIRVAETVIGRDCVSISFPKSILTQMNLSGKNAFFCITNGVLQVSGEVPAAVIPPVVLTEECFMPQPNE